MLNHPRLASQRGLSLVELMVGITVGLFIVGAATLVVTTQIGDNRRLLIETQLQQDLRASADIVTRELRRASYWIQADRGVWYPGSTSAVSLNQFGEISADGDADSIAFGYSRQGADDEDEPNRPYGFRLGDNGTIQTRLKGSGWQELTDPGVLKITAFDLDVEETPSERLPCPKLCDDGTEDCWPRQVARVVRISIAAEARNDASVSRTLTSVVRLRNDQIEFANGALICP